MAELLQRSNNTHMNHKSPVAFVKVTPDEDGQRIDNYLISHLKTMPKSHLYRLIRKGEIRVNKKRVGPDYRLIGDDIIRLPPMKVVATPPVMKPSASLIAVLKDSILYEDDYIMIINKPSGVAVHAGSTFKIGVIEALKAAYSTLPHLELVHRLDTETSGCLMIAKKKRILRELHTVLREGGMQKIYWTLTKGQWHTDECVVDMPLYKHYRDGGKHVVEVNHQLGKQALTVFTTLQHATLPHDISLMQATLMTGRTHQIRVHATSRRHPIAGDDRYGEAEFNKAMRTVGVERLFLHAHSLEFKVPSLKKEVRVVAPLDPTLAQVVKTLMNHNVMK